MSRPILAIKGASLLAVVAAVWATVGTALFPFVALFAADGPSSQSALLVDLRFLAIACLPFLAFIAGIFALANLFVGSSKVLMVAVLLVLPAVVGSTLVHDPRIFASKPKCFRQPPNGPPITQNVGCPMTVVRSPARAK